ncbi:MAG TPA: hypothetical protein VLB68_26235 [Pyrinomonadaceae bacterium]|nr:hypothetical protein [Pyrinomonadaceae bacterium]
MSKPTEVPTSSQSTTDVIKGWLMILLTVAFVVLYGLALMGKIRPLADTSIVSRIEPIIFVIIGYYFGRSPATQNERTLKDEITRQTQKADAAQYAKEQALQSREVFEEKLKNVNIALSRTASNLSSATKNAAANGQQEELKHSIDTALVILKS